MGNYGHVDDYGHVGDYGHVSDYVLWALMARPTFSCGSQWLTIRMFPLLLWVPMDGPTFSCGRLWLTSRMFPHPPNASFCLHRPTSFATVLSADPSFLSVLVGGVW